MSAQILPTFVIQMIGNACPMSFAQQNLESLPETHTTEDEDIIMFAAVSLFSGQSNIVNII